jgi:hypothetical protein
MHGIFIAVFDKQAKVRFKVFFSFARDDLTESSKAFALENL